MAGAIDKQRDALLELIDRYYEKQEKLFSQTIEKACSLAVGRVGEVINQAQDEEIRKLKEEINRLNTNRSTGSFLVDLLFAVVTAPVFGHLLRLGVKEITAIIVTDREIAFKAASELNSLARSGKWSNIDPKVFTNPRANFQMTEILLQDPVKLKRTGVSPVTMQKYFNYFTPFALEAAEMGGQKAIEGLTTARHSVGPEKPPEAPATPDLYEKLTQLNQLPISNIVSGIQNYTLTQISTSLHSKYTIRWIALTHPSETFLSDLADTYAAKLSTQPDFASVKLKDDIAMMFEAIMWIHYLGKPAKWAFSKDKKGGYYTTFVSQAPRDAKSAWERDYLRVFALRIAIPRVIFTYMLTTFTVPGTDESFLKHYTRTKQEALKTPRGYGVDKRDETGGWVWENYSPRYNTQWRPEKEIGDPTSIDYSAWDMAGHKMVEWFTELERALSESEDQLSSMLSGKGIEPVPLRPY
jgi:hypothetical protein